MSRTAALKTLAALTGVAAAVGTLVVGRPELILWAVGAALALVCPLWVLPSAAIAATALAPHGTDIGSVQIADVLFGILLVRGGRRVLGKWTLADALWQPEWWLGGFLAWAWISLLAAGALDTAPALARVTLYAAVFATLARVSGCARPLMVSIVALAVVEVGVALALGQVGPTTSKTLPWVPIRATGTTGDPANFGFIQLAALGFTLVLPKRARWYLTPVILAGIAMALTRNVWAAGVVEAGLLAIPALRVKPIRIVLAAACVPVIGLVAEPIVTKQLHLNPQSGEIRVNTIRGGLELTEAHPLFGVGWAQAQAPIFTRSASRASCGRGHARDDGRHPGAHGCRSPARGPRESKRPVGQHADHGRVLRAEPFNVWVNVASTTGVPGALLLTVFLGATLILLTRHRNPASQGVLIFLAGFLVFSLSDMSLYAGGLTAMMFFALLGAGVAAARDETGAPVREESLGRSRLARLPEVGGASRGTDER